jgi:hypothetical protein
MNIGKDWHGYTGIGEASKMFVGGIAVLLGLAAVSAYDVTGYRERQPWVPRHTSLPTAYEHSALQNRPLAVVEEPEAAGGDDY